MPKYLLKSRLSPQGIKGTMKEGGTARRTAVKEAIEAVGGKLEVFYYAFGSTDAYVIVDLPSDAHAVASSLTVGLSGTGSVETVVLVTPETMDEAAQIHTEYRAPGQ